MDADIIQKIFSEIQNTPKIFSVKFCNWPLWNIIKNPIFMQVLTRFSIGKKDTLIEKIKKRKPEFFGRAINYIIAKIEWLNLANTFASTQKNPIAMLIISSASRYKRDDGKYVAPFGEEIYLSKNRLFDMFIVESNKKSKRISNIVGKRHLRENIIDFPSIIETLIPKFKNQAFKKANKDLFNILEAQLNDYPNIKPIILEELNSKFIELKINNFIKEKKRASKILHKINPFVIILTSSQGHYGTIAAAKEFNIPIIEIQHGVLDKYHRVYNWPEFMRDKKKELLVPDQIFMWGKYWTEQNIKMGFWKKDELLPYGFTKMDSLKKKYENLNINKPTSSSKDKITFVFTAGEPYRKEAILFLKKTLEIVVKKKLPLRLIIKLHPLEDFTLKFYKILRDNFPQHCFIYHEKEKSLYNLFYEADVHLSVYSIAIFESIELGIPTAILNLPGKDFFYDLVDSRFVRFMKSPENLAQYIDEIKNTSHKWLNWIEDTKVAENYFFAKNTNQSYVNHLNELLIKKIKFLKK